MQTEAEIFISKEKDVRVLFVVDNIKFLFDYFWIKHILLLYSPGETLLDWLYPLKDF